MFRSKFSVGLCSECGNANMLVNKSLKLCIGCNQKRLYKQSLERKKIKIKDGKIINPSRLDKFYKQYWDTNKERFCYECGCPLYVYKKWHIHHVIPKRHFLKYLPIDIVYNNDFCIYLCLEHHAQAETNLDKVPLTKELTIKIKEKCN